MASNGLPRLLAIAAALRAGINREMGRMLFSETNGKIPREKFVFERQECEVCLMKIR